MPENPLTQPITITLTALPAKDGEPPPEIRLRQLLKIALRGFRFRADWVAPPAKSETQKAGLPAKESHAQR